MDSIPAISILMPLYRSQKYLKESIDSIINQTYGDFELLIIVDDATEETVSILSDYKKTDSRIKIFYNDHIGLINSLNLGIGQARGKYIARMDSDDICFPARLERQYRYMEEHREIGILGTSFAIIDGNGVTTGVFHPIANPGLIKWRLTYDNCLTHSSVMIRGSILKETGCYRLDAKYAEDYDLWVRASRLTDIANHRDVLMKYRVHDENVSSNHYLSQEQTVRKIICANFSNLLGYDVGLEQMTAIREFTRGNRLNDAGKISLSIRVLCDSYAAFIRNNELDAGEIRLITNDVAAKILKNALKESGIPVLTRAGNCFIAIMLKLKSYKTILSHAR
jgi:glycosyltransferase involved in cell wall biosynthesis